MIFHGKFISWVVLALAFASGRLSAAKPSSLRGLAGGAIARRTDLPPWPKNRFVEWDNVTEEVQKELKDILDYTKKTWNTPGLADIEFLSFSTINLTSLGFEIDENGQVSVGKKVLDIDGTPIDVIMNTLNITEEEVWDCHINHYSDYTWEELEENNLSEHYEGLGWNADMWLGDGYPDTEDLEWWQLNETQIISAENLCYKWETWSMLPLPLWTYNETTTNTTANDSNSEPENRPSIQSWDLPIVRFTEWQQLTLEQQGNANALGFNETTWNYLGTAEIESESFRYEDLNATQLTALTGLGIDEFFFNCLIQHYENFNWVELESMNDTMALWKELGWTFESWHELQPPPASEFTPWTRLRGPEKEAATQLCFVPETWYDPNKPVYHLSEINKDQFVQPSPIVRKGDGAFP